MLPRWCLAPHGFSCRSVYSLNEPTRCISPCSLTLRLLSQVNELSPSGTSVLPSSGSGAIQAYSKDSSATLTYAWYNLPPALAGWFIVDPNLGNVSVGTAGGGATNFLVSMSYNLTVQVTYVQLGLSDTAAVTIWVREVNKPSIWTGLYNATTGSAIASIVISEMSPINTVIGRVLFSDPNTAFPWNTRVYGIVGGAYGSGFFAVDSVSGVISLAQPLSWWDSPTYSLTISCTDMDPVAPLTSTNVITVSLLQVNTVSIASFSVPAFTDPTLGLNTSSSILMGTLGGVVVEIAGTGFGPTARFIAANAPPATTISASYGTAPYGPYGALSCAVYTPNTVIRCISSAGVGANLSWTVTVAGAWSATSLLSTAYYLPNITSVRKWTGTSYDSSSLLNTQGGELLAVDGTNLALVDEPSLAIQYWAAAMPGVVYQGSCAVSILAQRLVCSTASGVGAALSFQVFIW